MAWARSRRATRELRHAVLVGERLMPHSADPRIALPAVAAVGAVFAYRRTGVPELPELPESAELADRNDLQKELLGLATEALEHAVG